MIKLAVAGAAGRMGKKIIALAAADENFKLVAALEGDGHPQLGTDAGELAGTGNLQVQLSSDIRADFDVLIDFSQPAGTMNWLNHCRSASRPIIIGTTGHTPEQLAEIESAAQAIPVLKAANTSVGVNHRFKKDAPSGTALALQNAIIQATGRDPKADVVYGRKGVTGQRPPRQIGMHALRIGDTVGEHTIHFGNLGETVTIQHAAHTRDTFACGALRAAAWIAGKPTGRYDMHDVLGIK